MHHRLKQFVLFLGDLLMLYVGLVLAVTIRYRHWPDQELEALLRPMLHLAIAAAVIMFIVGLYDLARLIRNSRLYQKITLSAGLWLGTGVLYFYINPLTTVTPKTILLLTAVLGFACITLWRLFYISRLSSVIGKVTVVFAGFTPEVQELAELLTNEPQRGYAVAGCIIPTSTELPESLRAFPRAESLAALTKNTSFPSLIVITDDASKDEQLMQELYRAIFRQTSIMSLASFYEMSTERVPPFTFSESWFITNLNEQKRRVYDRFRLLIDYSVGIVIGAFFIVTFPLVALGIKLTSRGPIFFRQTRTGRLDKPFTIYKYRTMKSLAADGSAEVSGPEFAKVNDSRITAFGKILRKTRIDEVPQILNVLKGEMSLIGPRPERPEFVEELKRAVPYYALRHLIKPGLTGWAQLQRSYYGTIEENLHKLQYDLYYIKNRGLVLDLTILLKTINVVARFGGR